MRPFLHLSALHGISVNDSVTSTIRALQTDRRSRTVCSRVASLLTGLFVLITSTASFAQESRSAAATNPQVRVGWNGAYFVGRWIQVVVDVEATSNSHYRLQLTAPDPDGHRVIFSGHRTTFTSNSSGKLRPGRHELRGFCKLGQFDFARARTRPVDPEIEVRIEAEGSREPMLLWKASVAGATPFPPPLEPGTRLVVTVGDPRGFANSASGVGGVHGDGQLHLFEIVEAVNALGLELGLAQCR